MYIPYYVLQYSPVMLCCTNNIQLTMVPQTQTLRNQDTCIIKRFTCIEAPQTLIIHPS